jgi:hypothetical protein
MSYLTNQWLCSWVLRVMRALAGAALFFLPLLAHAELSDISRIYHQTPSLNQFEICQGGGCALASTTALSEQEWATVVQIFNDPSANAEDERQHIAQAIGVLENLVGQKTGTTADLAGTFFDGKLAGQQDCNDEAINSTTYMRLLKNNGLMLFHEIEDTRTRNFFFTGWPHTTAVIRDIETGERYAVDSWFYDNGHPATIVPFKQWKANFKPVDSPIGKHRAVQPTSAQAVRSGRIEQSGQ